MLKIIRVKSRKNILRCLIISSIFFTIRFPMMTHTEVPKHKEIFLFVDCN